MPPRRPRPRPGGRLLRWEIPAAAALLVFLAARCFAADAWRTLARAVRRFLAVWWPRRETEPALLRAHFRVCWHLGLAAVFGATLLAVGFWMIGMPGAVAVELVGLTVAGVYLLALAIHARRLLR